VQHAEAAFGMAERRTQPPDVLETKLDPERLEGEEAV
jgi:hypothetical protein